MMKPCSLLLLLTFALVVPAAANSSGLLNRSDFTDSTRTINFTSLSSGTYTYHVTINESTGISDDTGNRTITLLDSCLDSCAEDSSCTYSSDCVLYSDLCSDSVCDFDSLTLSSTIYTLYDSARNGRDLHVNITSNATRSRLTFLSGSAIVFSGKRGTEWGAGSSGGHGGNLTISVPDLFNTTNANFTALGGYSTAAGVGGNGGNVIFNYHGLIKNFTFGTPDPLLTQGTSVNSLYGSNGALNYNKDLTRFPLDADVTGDGKVDAFDKGVYRTSYGVVSTDVENYVADYDIVGKGRIDVSSLARIGFEYNTR